MGPAWGWRIVFFYGTVISICLTSPHLQCQAATLYLTLPPFTSSAALGHQGTNLLWEGLTALGCLF